MPLSHKNNSIIPISTNLGKGWITNISKLLVRLITIFSRDDYLEFKKPVPYKSTGLEHSLKSIISVTQKRLHL